jgi:AraC-like DNA-binding protein
MKQREKKTVDMSSFELLSFDDFTINDIIDYVGYDDTSYSKLEFVIVPKLRRMFDWSSISDSQAIVKQLKEEYGSQMLKDMNVSNAIYISQLLSSLSFNDSNYMSNKDKEYKTDDYKLFYSYDPSIFTKSDIQDNLLNAKYEQFSKIMKLYDKRRFSFSSVEDKSESLEFVIHEAIEDCINDVSIDVLSIRGINWAEDMIRKIIGKRNFSQNVWDMFRFCYTINNRQTSYNEIK